MSATRISNTSVFAINRVAGQNSCESLGADWEPISDPETCCSLAGPALAGSIADNPLDLLDSYGGEGAATVLGMPTSYDEERDPTDDVASCKTKVQPAWFATISGCMAYPQAPVLKVVFNHLNPVFTTPSAHGDYKICARRTVPPPSPPSPPSLPSPPPPPPNANLPMTTTLPYPPPPLPTPGLLAGVDASLTAADGSDSQGPALFIAIAVSVLLLLLLLACGCRHQSAVRRRRREEPRNACELCESAPVAAGRVAVRPVQIRVVSSDAPETAAVAVGSPNGSHHGAGGLSALARVRSLFV